MTLGASAALPVSKPNPVPRRPEASSRAAALGEFQGSQGARELSVAENRRLAGVRRGDRSQNVSFAKEAKSRPPGSGCTDVDPELRTRPGTGALRQGIRFRNRLVRLPAVDC